MWLMEKIKGVIRRMISAIDVQKAAKTDIAISDKMQSAIRLWGEMYTGSPPWLDDNVKSLNLPAAIASEIARLVTIEMESEVTGSARATYLNEQYRPVVQDARRYVEYGCAKGGLALKPYIDGKDIIVDYVQADCFFPTAFDGKGNITGAIFTEQKNVGRKVYTRIELHQLVDTGYKIQNSAYESEDAAVLGRPVPLAEVEDWAELEPEVAIANIDRPLFAYFRIPQANTIDTRSPLGVSVYARAVGLIEEADRQYGRILWEYEGGELAIDASASLYRKNQKTGKFELPKGKERLFRIFEGMSDGSDDQLREWAPTLRDTSLFNGLNQLLMKIEDTCGLARGTFTDPQGEAKTATELKILRQRSYATVTDTQKAWQDAMEQLVYAMDVWATIGSLAPSGAYEVNSKYDDSVLMDIDAQRALDIQDVRDGIMAKWEYRVKYMGEDEATAKRMVAEAQKDSGGGEESLPFGGGDG